MEGGCTRAMHRLTFLTFNGRLPWTFLPLVLVLLAGLSLRLYGVDWDSGYGFHPDERDIYMRSGCMFDLLTEAPGHQECGYLVDHPEAEPGVPGLGTFLDPERSPLNPHWFPLGSILIYVLVAIRSIIELFADINALDMRFVGRVLSALADVGSIFLVYVLGRRMYGPGVGVLACGVYRAGGDPYPTQPFLPARNLFRAVYVGQFLGNAPHGRAKAPERLGIAGLAGRAGAGAQD